MEKTLVVDGQQVNFKASSGTFRRYRFHFRRDLLTDMKILGERVEKLGEDAGFTLNDLEMFENIAWIMAKTADDSVPDVDIWMDQFETFSIYEVLPELLKIFAANMEKTVEAKNSLATAAGKR